MALSKIEEIYQDRKWYKAGKKALDYRTKITGSKTAWEASSICMKAMWDLDINYDERKLIKKLASAVSKKLPKGVI